MKNLFSRKNIFILIGLFIIISSLIFVSSTLEKNLNDRTREKLWKDLNDERIEIILRAIISDPEAVKIEIEGEDITDEFLNKYSSSINNKNYTEAMYFIRNNKIAISISSTKKNEFLIRDLTDLRQNMRVLEENQ